ncbi:hypothetical protein SAMN05661096_01718 [Marivirga sericea]|uniref:Uncharacterized protein n=1 Tax=Marivirga sericea TaxID=1028 RepID=A0A1X7JKA0_9BACT|nr:hypothetical protein SAMN05661096_01718 [Marivirga sericea]
MLFPYFSDLKLAVIDKLSISETIVSASVQKLPSTSFIIILIPTTN